MRCFQAGPRPLSATPTPAAQPLSQDPQPFPHAPASQAGPSHRGLLGLLLGGHQFQPAEAPATETAVDRRPGSGSSGLSSREEEQVRSPTRCQPASGAGKDAPRSQNCREGRTQDRGQAGQGRGRSWHVRTSEMAPMARASHRKRDRTRSHGTFTEGRWEPQQALEQRRARLGFGVCF